MRLCALLIKSNDPWVQLNAAFIAGEIGVHDDEISCGLLDLLQSPITVVRQAIDAIAFAKLNNYQGILRQLKELILNKRQEGSSRWFREGGALRTKSEMNIAMFLLSNWGKFETNDLMEISEIMLRKSNDYSSSIVAEALVRSGNSVAQRLAIDYFQSRS